jgi:hypothetical protein
MGHSNLVWGCGDFQCNIGELSGVIVSPTKNGSHQLGTRIGFGGLDISVVIFMNLVEYNFGKLSGVIELPTQKGSQTLVS